MTERESQGSTETQPPHGSADRGVDRRRFLATTTNVVMASGLAAGYGTFVVMAGRFLFVSNDQSTAWHFLATTDDLEVGDSFTYISPSGAQVVVARQSSGSKAEDFVALSSVCPHLGCQVHWEAQNDRFFCPCHNGAFDRQGNPTEGPPASAGQQLTRFPLKVEDGLIFIKAPVESVT